MRIALINTGGTISCTGTPLAPMGAAPFAAAARATLDPIFAQQFDDVDIDYITDLSFPESQTGTLDSTNLQPSDWCLLADRILNDYATYDAWIVLHGTDTMAYTAGALPFLLSAFDARGVAMAVLDKPVVLTGSQVPLFSEDAVTGALSLRFNTDAFQNVCAAVAAARTGIPEVMVAFRGDVFRGARVLKTNATMDDAFSSPNLPPLAQLGITMIVDPEEPLAGPADRSLSLSDAATLARAQDRLAHISARIPDTAVAPLAAFPAAVGAPGFLEKLIDAYVDAGANGIVLESYGEGNFPSGNPDDPATGAIARAIRAATAAGVLVVNATQVLAGTVDATAYAAGSWLAEAGAVSIGDMTPIAALTKALVLLAERGWTGNDWQEPTVRHLMRLSLLGESRVTDRIDAHRRPHLLPGEQITSLDGSRVLINDERRGPTLKDADGTVLWTALTSVGPDRGGRLIADGRRVVFRDRDGRVLWSAGEDDVSGFAVQADGNANLVLLDPLGRPGAVLWPVPR